MDEREIARKKIEVASEVLRAADYANMHPGLAAGLDEYDPEAQVIAAVTPTRLSVSEMAEAVKVIMGFFFHNVPADAWCEAVAARLKEEWPDDGRDDLDWREAFEFVIARSGLIELKEILDEQMKDLPVGSRARPANAVAYTYHFVARVQAAKRIMDGE